MVSQLVKMYPVQFIYEAIVSSGYMHHSNIWTATFEVGEEAVTTIPAC